MVLFPDDNDWRLQHLPSGERDIWAYKYRDLDLSGYEHEIVTFEEASRWKSSSGVHLSDTCMTGYPSGLSGLMMEREESRERMGCMLGVETLERMGLMESIERRERMEWVERRERLERMGLMGLMESIERMEGVERRERMDRIDGIYGRLNWKGWDLWKEGDGWVSCMEQPVERIICLNFKKKLSLK
jgi:hypothetical protein